MQNLPVYIPVLFMLTTMLTLFFIVKAFRYSKKTIALVLIWLTVQAIIANTGFYTHTSSLPPRFLLAFLPPLVTIIILFATINGRKIIDNLPAETLTLLHIVRLPVEIVLLMLFIHKDVPAIMTFEGKNLDIVSGITAPFVYYFSFVIKKIKPIFIILWNILCLLLLGNVVVTAVLSFPFPFQQFGFEQPNIALLYAPYIWLPSFIVPVVLFSHFVVLRQLTTKIVGGNPSKQDLQKAM